MREKDVLIIIGNVYANGMKDVNCTEMLLEMLHSDGTWSVPVDDLIR